VEIYGRLAAASPARYEPDLAESLNNLSNHLGVSGDPQGALDAIREAVEIYRRLAAASPVRYEPDLARSVSVMSDRLEEEGNRGNQGSLATDAALRRTLSGQRTRAPLRGDAAGLRAPYGQRETGHLR
jgi:hypothetical protein